MADRDYPLHKCIFTGTLKDFEELAPRNDIHLKDKHGNTALHLAIMLGKKDIARYLIDEGASVKVKNALGWNPLAEAISYGDREMITLLYQKFNDQMLETLKQRRPLLLTGLSRIPDFYLEMKWDFHCWVPLVNRFLPSDLCKIRKRGPTIRVDSTLVDFNDFHWERGDITLLFLGDNKPGKTFVVLDNKLKVYQWLKQEESEHEMDIEVDNVMSTDIMSVNMSTKSIVFNRAQSGWIFKEDRTEMIGPFSSECYHVTGMKLESRKRREHLTEEDVQYNKAVMETITNPALCAAAVEQPNRETASTSSDEDEIKESKTGSDGSSAKIYTPRKSLQPPEPTNVTWEEYINSLPGKFPCLGRKIVLKQSTKTFRATVAMSSEFPLTIDMLLNVLDVITPLKHLEKFRKFVELKLPPGFPIRLDIPILPTVSAKVTFQEFRFLDDCPQELFEIPLDYKEDPKRFMNM